MSRTFEFRYADPVEPIALDPPDDCFRDMFDNQYIYKDDCVIYTSPDSSTQYICNG